MKNARLETINVKSGLPPVVWESSRILILGTMTGDESLRKQRYYANPSNKFWLILSKVYGGPIGTDYGERLEFLRRKGLALWDVLRSCERSGSSDGAIKSPVPNDFAALLEHYPRLQAVAFNGQKAETLFNKHVGSQLYWGSNEAASIDEFGTWPIRPPLQRKGRSVEGILDMMKRS